MRFAKGTHALAICDRCGFSYKYLELREEWNGLRVCPTCFEPKHPQLETPRHRPDAEALRDARPEKTEPLVIYVSDFIQVPPFERRAVNAHGKVGRVTVTVS